MKTRIVTAIIIAASLGGLGSPAARACGSGINIAAIEHRMADPGLDSDVLEKAKTLKAEAAAAIEANKRDEGRALYYSLMKLLNMPIYRC